MRFGPLIGAAQLAVGRRAGIERFGDTSQAFLASLAPLVAFPLVGSLIMLMSGSVVRALTTFLMTLSAQLAPAVVSHAVARWWGREAAWLRYATAFNWCHWVIPVAVFAFMILTQILIGLGLPSGAAGDLLVLMLAGYGLWLHWTIARAGLGLSWSRCVALVVIVNAATAAVVLVPRLLAA